VPTRPVRIPHSRSRRPRRAPDLRVEPLEGRALAAAITAAAPSRSPAESRGFAARRRPAPVEIRRDITYSPAGYRLDVYLPTAPAPADGRPAILAIHGGGWRKFDKGQYGPKVSALARDGYVIVAPDYTLSAPGAPSWPRNFEDVREAVRWVRRNAVELGVDPDRIAAIGESAGAHLAALLGTVDDPPGAGLVSSRVQAVISVSGPTDLAALHAGSAAGGAAASQFLGGPPSAVPARYLAASPTTHATADDAPFLILQGTADTIVPADQATRLDAALDRVGVPRRLIVLAGASHGFGWRVSGRDLLAEVRSFLAVALRPDRP